MLSRAIKRLFGIFERASKSVAAGYGGVFLHGEGNYPYDVTDVSDLQQDLYECLGRIVQAADEFPCLAVLDFARADLNPADKVAVIIDGRAIGSCPSYLGNQIREWLDEWDYSHANVQCRALITHRRGIRASHTDRYIVKLDIAVPFRMTTF